MRKIKLRHARRHNYAPYSHRETEISAELERGEDLDTALQQLHDAVARSLLLKTMEGEKAEQLLDLVDADWQGVISQRHHAQNCTRQARSYLREAAKQTEEKDSHRRDGNEHEAREQVASAVRTLAAADGRADVLRKKEEEPAVRAARALLARPAPELPPLTHPVFDVEAVIAAYQTGGGGPVTAAKVLAPLDLVQRTEEEDEDDDIPFDGDEGSRP